MVSYDSDKVEETIMNLKQELKDQQQLNEILKDNDFDKNQNK